MLTMELAYYENVNIRGMVNDTTVHAQKHDVCGYIDHTPP